MSSFRVDINQFNQFIIPAEAFLYDEEQLPENAVGEIFSFHALVDTGATRSMITKRIVTELQLKIYRETTIGTAGEPYRTRAYPIGLAVTILGTRERVMKTSGGDLARMDVPVIAARKAIVTTAAVLPVADRGFDVLLGMDMLNELHIVMHKGTLTVTINDE